MPKSTLSNQQCNYLLTQFESFAKQFTNNSSSSSSPSSSSSLSSSSYSTLLKSSSNHVIPCKIKSVTLNKYSSFNHDLVDKCSHVEAIKRGGDENEKEQIITKNRNETTLSNLRFKQKMLNINNIDLASQLLSQPSTNDATQNAFINDYMTFLKENNNNNVNLVNNNNNNEINKTRLESESKEKLTSDDLHRTHCLSEDTMQLTPKFLHIDDDQEEEEEECSGDDETFKTSKCEFTF